MVQTLLESEFPGHSNTHAQHFFRVMLHGEIYYCENYQRVKKRNSYTMIYVDGEGVRFGHIEQYLLIQNVPMAVVRRLEIASRSPFGHHSHLSAILVQPASVFSYSLIAVHNIKEKCLYVEVEDNVAYIFRFPSKFLND